MTRSQKPALDSAESIMGKTEGKKRTSSTSAVYKKRGKKEKQIIVSSL